MLLEQRDVPAFILLLLHGCVLQAQQRAANTTELGNEGLLAIYEEVFTLKILAEWKRVRLAGGNGDAVVNTRGAGKQGRLASPSQSVCARDVVVLPLNAWKCCLVLGLVLGSM